MIINKETSCSFSGHRLLENDFDKVYLKKQIENVIERGYNTFLVGMALGFDTEVFHVLEEIKKNKNIKIVACIPCEKQAEKFSEVDNKEYYRMLKVSDEQIFVNKAYTSYCMKKRNKFMVDNSSILINYLRQSKGGTFFTVNYATQNKLEIISI